MRARTAVRSGGGPRRALRVAAVVGAAYRLWLCWRMSGRTDVLYQGGFLFGVAAISVVIVVGGATRPGGVGHVPVARPPLRWVGRISYGLYLWHWPIIVWLTPARTGLDGVWLLGLRVAVMAVVVMASYYLVERPIRHGSLAPRQLLVWGGAAAICCLGLILALTNGPSVPVLASSGGAPTPAADAPSKRPASPAPTAAPRPRRQLHRPRCSCRAPSPAAGTESGPAPARARDGPADGGADDTGNPSPSPRRRRLGRMVPRGGHGHGSASPRRGGAVQGWIGCGVRA